MRAERRRLAAEGPGRERAVGDFERVALPSADADVVRDLLVAAQARTVIEIGLAYGASALAIAEALVRHGGADVRHVVVDPYQEHFHGAGWDAIVRAGLTDTCTLVEERSQLALARFVADGVVVDAAFVDGSHVFHHVFVDLFFLGELVRPGGLVVVDDVEWPAVGTAVRYFERNAGWRPRAIDQDTRVRAFTTPVPRPEHRFEDFRPFALDD